MTAKEFGFRLYQFREQRQLSMAELARQIGIDYMQVHRYERGQSVPSLETAVRLANVLQIPLDVLVTGKEAPVPVAPIRNARLLQQVQELETLPPERQELASRLLEAVIAGELDAVARRIRRL
ncbi:MAG TPA: helix-turn-helix transcriptional regulator [Thermoanaerobaculia bacterium]|jgi:transcriptional regulator with XRE-family HTH domain